MTPNAQHKRAERERRTARGDKRIEVWVSAEDYAWLKVMARCESVSEVLSWCVGKTRSEGWEIRP